MSGYPGSVQYHLGQLKQKPLPDDLESYVITVAPRISAFNEIYKKVKPNGGYYKYNWWKYYNAAQKEFLGFVSRQETAIQPWYSWNYYPFVGLFPNMDETRNYLKKQNVQITDDKTGNSLVLTSKFDLTFKNPPINFNNRLYFKKGFTVLQSPTIDQSILYRFDTPNKKVKLWIQENKYIDTAKTAYAPLYFYLNYQDQRPFYTDISYRYTSVSIPIMNFKIKEDTQHLNGMYLERINNCTSEIERIQIQNVLQYTDIIINSGNKGIINFEMVNKNYDVNAPFMMWLEYTDIRFFPLFIGFFGKSLFR